jgi:hypothetical protein
MGEDLIDFIERELGTVHAANSYREQAIAVLKSIEASGTHVVVPVEPTKEMVRAGDNYLIGEAPDVWPRGVYEEMIAARPKVAVEDADED